MCGGDYEWLQKDEGRIWGTCQIIVATESGRFINPRDYEFIRPIAQSRA